MKQLISFFDIGDNTKEILHIEKNNSQANIKTNAESVKKGIATTGIMTSKLRI